MGVGGGDLMVKLGNFCHCQGDTLCQCIHLDLQVYEESVQTPPTNDLDITIRDVGLVDRHGAPWEKWVVSNIVRVETQALEADLGGMEAEEGDDVSTGYAFMNHALGVKIRADVGVRFGLVWVNVEEASIHGVYRVVVG